MHTGDAIWHSSGLKQAGPTETLSHASAVFISPLFVFGCVVAYSFTPKVRPGILNTLHSSLPLRRQYAALGSGRCGL